MTELIIALDLDDPIRLMAQLNQEAGVKFFKFGSRALLDPGIWSGIIHAKRFYMDCDLFLDLKLYDTKDTVSITAQKIFDLGTRFLTVHATPSMLESAMKAKINDSWQKVIAVGPLTDNPDLADRTQGLAISLCDGFICSTPMSINFFREFYHLKDKLFICPGIRPFSSDPHNHYQPHTPLQAKNYGADYIVVGRPITLSPDPIYIAQSILDEIKD